MANGLIKLEVGFVTLRLKTRHTVAAGSPSYSYVHPPQAQLPFGILKDVVQEYGTGQNETSALQSCSRSGLHHV